MANKQFKVSLSKKDAAYLKEIAKKLGVSETDVLRKGLELMTVYFNSTPKKASLIFKQGNREKKIVFLQN